MKIGTENVLDTTLKEVGKLVETAIGSLGKYADQFTEKVQKEYLPLIEELVKDINGGFKGCTFGKEVEELDMATIIAFIKEYMVEKSNEVVALKTKQEEGYYLYLAYSKDRDLLPKEENKYLIIKAKTLSKEVEELFVNSECVILK
ncbi:MAG TPA: hypothetical protein DDY68_06085 [Porphyromonadaceae bacterium]|nr:hypothetical protein [Porphyromonadaceae bacterium]